MYTYKHKLTPPFAKVEYPCADLCKGTWVTMMMPFICSYRNKNEPTAIYPSFGYSPLKYPCADLYKGTWVTMMFITDGQNSSGCRGLRHFVFSLGHRWSTREEPGRGSCRNSQKSVRVYICCRKKCTKTLTFENLGLAQFAVCVGQARRFGLACEHIENVRGSSEMSEEALECQCPGIFTVLEH